MQPPKNQRQIFHLTRFYHIYLMGMMKLCRYYIVYSVLLCYGCYLEVGTGNLAIYHLFSQVSVYEERNIYTIRWQLQHGQVFTYVRFATYNQVHLYLCYSNNILYIGRLWAML